MRRTVEARDSKANPWRCLCGEADERVGGGRRYHDAKCPVERWLTDPNFGDPARGEKATPWKGPNAHQQFVFVGKRKWSAV